MIKNILKGFPRLLFSSLLCLLVFAFFTYAASTISTNISTDGTLTVNGNSTFGDAATDVNLFTGTLQASTTALFTSGFTTFGASVFNENSGALDFRVESDGQANMLYVDGTNDRVGIASSTPYVALGVVGTTTSSLGMRIGATGSGITQLYFGTCSVNLPNITASSTASADCTATGVNLGDKVFVTPASLENHVVFTSASTTAADTIQVSAYNYGGGQGTAVNPAAATWSWMAVR